MSDPRTTTHEESLEEEKGQPKKQGNLKQKSWNLINRITRNFKKREIQLVFW